jgi:hypothetical protein
MEKGGQEILGGGHLALKVRQMLHGDSTAAGHQARVRGFCTLSPYQLIALDAGCQLMR